jgi:succinate-semialdehyde dehydrogenase / glutarate-semialdehyde dehydrogenase
VENTTALFQEKLATTPLTELVTSAHLPDLSKLTTLVTRALGQREETTVRAPFTGQVLGSVPVCTAEDVHLALARARTAQAAWARTSLAQRKRIFLRYHDLLGQHRDEFLDLIQLEAGKTRLNALDEVFDVSINCRHYAARAARYLHPQRRKGAIPIFTQAVEHHHPKGVVGIIAPWNYPLSMAISDAIPAIIAGNSVVLKPAEETPFTALFALSLLYQAGLPQEVFQVVTGRGRVIGPAMLEEIDYLAFTGGTSTGRKLASQAGERLIKCSMELGGKNPAIVLDDADLDKSVEGVLHAAFSSAGQLCVHMERLYLQDGIHDRFVQALVRRVKAMKISAALEFDVDMGSLISREQFDKTSRMVADAVSKGAALLAGGKPRLDLGPYFYEPTLLAGVTAGMEVYAEEVFGPVLCIYRFHDIEQAVQAANASEYGLNASIWTRNIRLGRQIARRIQAGALNINDGYSASWGSVDAPMGGMKASGIGRRHGVEGILKYTESQTVAVQSVIPFGPFGILYPERYANVMGRILKLMKDIPFLR